MFRIHLTTQCQTVALHGTDRGFIQTATQKEAFRSAGGKAAAAAARTSCAKQSNGCSCDVPAWFSPARSGQDTQPPSEAPGTRGGKTLTSTGFVSSLWLALRGRVHSLASVGLGRLDERKD